MFNIEGETIIDKFIRQMWSTVENVCMYYPYFLNNITRRQWWKDIIYNKVCFFHIWNMSNSQLSISVLNMSFILDQEAWRLHLCLHRYRNLYTECGCVTVNISPTWKALPSDILSVSINKIRCYQKKNKKTL